MQSTSKRGFAVQMYRLLRAILIIIVFQCGFIHAAHRVVLRAGVALAKHVVTFQQPVVSRLSGPIIRRNTSPVRPPVIILAHRAHERVTPFLTCADDDLFVGGHTVEQHIAITDAQLQERLLRGATISAATKFIDYQTAVAAVRDSLRAHVDGITEWMASEEQAMKCLYRHEQPIGYGFRAGGTCTPHIKYLYHSCTVLQKQAGSFSILTPYPLALNVPRGGL